MASAVGKLTKSTSGLSHKQQASSRRPHFRAIRKVLWKMFTFAYVIVLDRVKSILKPKFAPL